MKKFIRLMIGVLALTWNFSFAGEPTSDLSAQLAVKLIALRSSLQANTVEISFIVDGVSKADCFDVKHARRVAAIHAVQNGSKQRRELVFYDLFWNESLGWFMWKSREERTGEAVYLWSETRGAIVNR